MDTLRTPGCWHFDRWLCFFFYPKCTEELVDNREFVVADLQPKYLKLYTQTGVRMWVNQLDLQLLDNPTSSKGNDD